MGLFGLFKKRKVEQEKTTPVTVTVSSVQTRTDAYRKDEQVALFLHFMDAPVAVVSDGCYSYHVRFHCGELISPSRLHRQLISEGYFVPEPTESKLGRLKVQELRDLAVQHSIDIKGKKKADLVTALCSCASEMTIDLPAADERYVLSGKAREYLKNYEVLLYLADHREYGISIREFESAAKKQKGTYRDVIWRIFNDEMNHLLAGRNYGAVCQVYNCMATFLLEENHYKDALRFYLLILYFNVNYPAIQQLLAVGERTKQYNKDLIISLFETNYFDTSVAKKIVDLSSYYDTSIAVKVIAMRLLPYEFVPKETFVEMIHELLENPLFDSAEYLSVGRKAIERKLKGK